MERAQLTVERKMTYKELIGYLGVTPMTIHLWRKLTDPLPCREIPVGESHRVYFFTNEVRIWLEKYRPHLVGRIGGPHGSDNANDNGTGSRGASSERLEGAAA
jgi:hypothetical protein